MTTPTGSVYVKLTISHDNKQMKYEWFDNLDELAQFIWHLGLKNDFVVVDCEQITFEEYEENYLPF